MEAKLETYMLGSESKMDIDVYLGVLILTPVFQGGRGEEKRKRKEPDLLKGGKNPWGKFHFSTDWHKKLNVWPYGF